MGVFYIMKVNSQQSTVNSQQSANLNNFKSYVNSDLKNQSYDLLKNLIHNFKSNYSQYTNKNYNETETRRDFLDPFFEAFGFGTFLIGQVNHRLIVM